MSLKKKILDIILLIIPVLLMVILIPIILNDYSLAGIYLLIIGMFFILGYKKKDWQFFLFGLIAMTISESFFISTGVESFARNSLFSIIPIWLPILWAFAFVIMRRIIIILNK